MSGYINFENASRYGDTRTAVTGAYPENGGQYTTMAVGEEGGNDFATTLATGEEGGGIATTKALGEEGGDTITTMAVGEEGGNDFATTLATGEEGGGIATTKALGEEGGDTITTMAVGEEGDAVTLALYEDGYTLPPQRPETNASKDTYAYIDFLRDADYTGNYDGQLTRTEAVNQVERYKDDLRSMETFLKVISFFIPFASILFGALTQNLRQKIGTGNRLLNSFNLFAQGGLWPQPQDNPRTVTENNIWAVAWRDNNPYDVSSQDLKRRPQYLTRFDTR